MGLVIILVIVLIVVISKKSSSDEKYRIVVHQSEKKDSSDKRKTKSGNKSKRKKSVQDAVWIPPGQSISVEDREIPGGMLYFGTRLRSEAYSSDEPSLINPNVPVNWSNPTNSSIDIGYWPSYSEISPGSRAAYLNWLIGGRCDPECNIQYVFIFFYGLERRFFIDMARSDSAKEDLVQIVVEVKRLIDIYGSNRSFVSYADSLLNAVLLKQLPARYYDTEPPSENHDYEFPVNVRYALA